MNHTEQLAEQLRKFAMKFGQPEHHGLLSAAAHIERTETKLNQCMGAFDGMRDSYHDELTLRKSTEIKLGERDQEVRRWRIKSEGLDGCLALKDVEYADLQSRLDTCEETKTTLTKQAMEQRVEIYELQAELGTAREALLERATWLRERDAEIESLVSRVGRVEEALGEAMEWNWLDADMPKDARDRIEFVYKDSSVEGQTRNRCAFGHNIGMGKRDRCELVSGHEGKCRFVSVTHAGPKSLPVETEIPDNGSTP